MTLEIPVWLLVVLGYLALGIANEVMLYRRMVFVDWPRWWFWLPVRLVIWPVFYIAGT